MTEMREAIARVIREIYDPRPANAPDDWHDNADETADAILALLPSEGWRDISTAPKDGTSILIFGDGCMSTAAWGPVNNPFGLSRGNGWRCESTPDIEGSPSDGIDPTHWRPLPAPPLPQQEAV